MSKYWSKEEFIAVVKRSKSISEVLRYFQLPSNQGHYNRLFHKSVVEFNVDISHIFDNANKKPFPIKQPLELLLTKGKYRSVCTLKKRLIKEGILSNECAICGLKPIWNGKSLSLQLDHINGDNADNRLQNLRILCPNCHTQTETWGAKRHMKNKHAFKFVCQLCGKQKKYSKSEKCHACESNNRTKKIQN
jgi:hypothetical protein